MKIDVVIPLISRDYERFRILYKSMSAFFNCLGVCWIVVPYGEERLASSLCSSDKHYRVICEESVVPELSSLCSAEKPRGWFRQQMVKLGIASRVTSEFYLALDADCICVRPVDHLDLVQDERGLVQYKSDESHPEWYGMAEGVLKVPRPKSSVAATPFLFHRGSVIALQNRLERDCDVDETWRGYLWKSIPWTEYTLYHTFCHDTGRWERYHRSSEHHLLRGPSVWRRHELTQWNPSELFRRDAPFLFSVVQSNTGISAAATWRLVRNYL